MRAKANERFPTPAGFNEAAGVDPADACVPNFAATRYRPSRFNEAAGVDPADAPRARSNGSWPLGRFNEAAGVDPADAASPASVSTCAALLQ